MTPRPLVSATGLTKRYGSTVALDAVDLALGRGVTGLLGPNGAGKTTLIRLLTTATPPTSGQISVLGHPATGSDADRTEVRRSLGYLPQEVDFPRGFTTFAFLDYIAVLKEWTDTSLRHAEARRVLAGRPQTGAAGPRGVWRGGCRCPHGKIIDFDRSGNVLAGGVRHSHSKGTHAGVGASGRRL